METDPYPHTLNVAVHLGDLLWTLSPECGCSSWAARNNGLRITTVCKELTTRINCPWSQDSTPTPPLTFLSFFVIPATSSHHRSFISLALPHSQGWGHLEISPFPADALINLSCFTNSALLVPPSANLTELIIEGDWFQRIGLYCPKSKSRHTGEKGHWQSGPCRCELTLSTDSSLNESPEGEEGWRPSGSFEFPDQGSWNSF